MKKTPNFSESFYDEKNQILSKISYEQNVDENTGEVSDMVKVDKTFYGDAGWWKIYLQQFLMVLGKFNINILNVMCFICENTSTGNNIFLGTIDTIAEYVGISRSTVIRCMKELSEAGFIKMVARGQYMVNPNIMYVGGGKKNPGKRGFLVELYEGTTAPDGVNPHRRYKTKSIK